MECPYGHGFHGAPVSEMLFKAGAHLPRRLVGECDGSNLGRLHAALFDQIGDAADQRLCFARSGTGDDGDGGFTGGNGLPLLPVQSVRRALTRLLSGVRLPALRLGVRRNRSGFVRRLFFRPYFLGSGAALAPPSGKKTKLARKQLYFRFVQYFDFAVCSVVSGLNLHLAGGGAACRCPPQQERRRLSDVRKGGLAEDEKLRSQAMQ